MGGGAEDYGSSNYSAGYNSYSPGDTDSGADPSHSEYEYFQGGWQAAKDAYEQEETLLGMMEEMYGGSHEADESHEADADDEQDAMDSALASEDTTFEDLQEYISTEADPDATYETLTYDEEGNGWVWDPEDGYWVQRDEARMWLQDDEGVWAKYDTPTGGYGWTSGDGWEASGSDLSGYSRIYSSSGDMYERSTFDELMEGRLDAATAATEYVNNQIAEESANAALLGVEYSMTDDRKSSRINNYFATIWSESDESTATELAEVWGEDLSRSGVERGNADLAAEGGGETVAKTSSGMTPVLATTEEENTLGGRSSVLGA